MNRSPILAFAVCVTVLGACYQMPRQRGGSVETQSSGKLATRNPADVVVAPIEFTSTDRSAPAAALRSAFHAGLVRRRYSPLALEFVDRRVVNAAYPIGALNEEAVLQVSVESWDATLWDSRSILHVKLRARMLDSADPSGASLWSGAVDRRFDFGIERDRFATREAMERHACERIATEVLAALPSRTPSP